MDLPSGGTLENSKYWLRQRAQAPDREPWSLIRRYLTTFGYFTCNYVPLIDDYIMLIQSYNTLKVLYGET